MKILMISSEPQYIEILPELNIFARDWDKSLTTAGHQVTSVNLQKIFFLRYVVSKGLNFEILRDFRALSFVPNWTFISGFIFCLRGILYFRSAAKSHDLILCHNFIWAGVLGCILNWNCHKRLLIIEHNINKTLKNESWLHKKFLRLMIDRNVVELLCLNADHAALYAAEFNVKASQIVNPVDEVFCSSPINQVSNFDMISIGSFDRNKGQLFQLEILRKLPEKYTLTIVGDGPLLHEIKSKIFELNLTDRVKLAGSVSRSKVCGLLDSHAILLNTSISETFGVVNTEAGCRGLFVVSCDNGGVWNSTLECNRKIIENKRDADVWADAISSFQPCNHDRIGVSREYQNSFSTSRFLEGLQLK